MSTSIRAVLFDCDGVLQKPSNDWAADVGALTGLAGDRLEAFLGDVSAVEQPALTGSQPFAVPLAAVVAGWDLEVAVDDLLQVWQHVSVDEGVLAGARALRAEGIACALGTNQHRERGAYVHRSLGYAEVFDPIVISAEVGVSKPDPEFFRTAVTKIGVPAGQVLFMDDVQGNVDGARSVGLVAELFARDGGRVELDRILALHGLAERVAA